ncbi:MAG: UvrD-helicase domain-containing protein [Halanaerobiaceae bacterium]
MALIYSGSTGSGKTTLLLDRYTELSNIQGTDKCLVFVKNGSSKMDWRNKIELETMGMLNVFTYFSFVQQEISDYWPWIESELSGGHRTIDPTFMNVETSHYLMSKYVEKNRLHKEVFDYISATSPQIAVQLIDNLNQAAMNALSLQELEERLLSWAVDDSEKIMVLNESVAIMKKFRKFCRENRILDYSLMIDLYNKYLLTNKNYLEQLTGRYKFFFVDNLEKTVPSAQKLIRVLLNSCEETYMSYNPEEGINKFFGGNAELARDIFFPLCDIKELKESYTSSKNARDMAESLYEIVFQNRNITVNNYIRKEINSELRGEMLVSAAEEIVSLLEEGVSPDEIAIIAPIVDKVMEFTLERYITERGYSFINMTRSKRLVDVPFSQALITLTLMANPEWSASITYSALQQTLSLILKLDPIRSAVLTDEIFKNNMFLPELEKINLRSRIGFDNSAKYDYLKEWLEEKQTQNLELEHFFQVVFGELLSPLSPTEEDILACRQMIKSVTKFKDVIQNFKDIPEEEIGRHFIDMIYNGTLAAEVLYNYPEEEEKIVLSTPYKFLYSPDIEKVRYLFWLDISSENWMRSISKELFNPYILSPQWKRERTWDDNIDQNLRKEQLLANLQSILSKSTDGLYIVDSYLNSRGWEQEGQLYEWLQTGNKGVSIDD